MFVSLSSFVFFLLAGGYLFLSPDVEVVAVCCSTVSCCMCVSVGLVMGINLE